MNQPVNRRQKEAKKKLEQIYSLGLVVTVFCFLTVVGYIYPRYSAERRMREKEEMARNLAEEEKRNLPDKAKLLLAKLKRKAQEPISSIEPSGTGVPSPTVNFSEKTEREPNAEAKLLLEKIRGKKSLSDGTKEDPNAEAKLLLEKIRGKETDASSSVAPSGTDVSSPRASSTPEKRPATLQKAEPADSPKDPLPGTTKSHLSHGG